VVDVPRLALQRPGDSSIPIPGEREHDPFERGAIVTVFWKEKTDSYVGNDGAMKHQTTFIVSQIVGVVAAGSANSR
jgi:hypothetical protein